MPRCLKSLSFLALTLFSCQLDEAQKALSDLLPPDTNLLILQPATQESHFPFFDIQTPSVYQENLSEWAFLIRLDYEQDLWVGGKSESDSFFFTPPLATSQYQGYDLFFLEDAQLYLTYLGGFQLVSTEAIGLEKCIYQWENGSKSLEESFPERGTGILLLKPLGWMKSGWWTRETSTNIDDLRLRGPALQEVPALPEEVLQTAFLYSTDVELDFSGIAEEPAYRLSQNRAGEEVFLFARQPQALSQWDVLKTETDQLTTVSELLGPDGQTWYAADRGAGAFFLSPDKQRLERFSLDLDSYGMLTAQVQQRLEIMNRLPEQAVLLSDHSKQENRILTYYWKGNLYSLLSDVQEQPIAETWRTTLNTEPISELFHLPENDWLVLQKEDRETAVYNANGVLVHQFALDDLLVKAWEISLPNQAEKSDILLLGTKGIYRLSPKGKSSLRPIWISPGAPLVQTQVVLTEALGDHYIYVLTDEGKAYAFNQNGVPLTGWESGVLAGPSDFEPLFFQWGREDYLAVLDTAGVLRTFDRIGNPHWVSSDSIPGVDQLQLILSEQTQRIVYLAEDGAMRVHNLAGESFGLRIPVSLPVHQLAIASSEGEDLYQVLDQQHWHRAKYQGNQFGVEASRKAPGDCEDIDQALLAEGNQEVLAWWSSKQQRLCFDRIPDQLPFDRRPIVTREGDHIRAIGLLNGELMAYRIPY